MPRYGCTGHLPWSQKRTRGLGRPWAHLLGKLDASLINEQVPQHLHPSATPRTDFPVLKCIVTSRWVKHVTLEVTSLGCPSCPQGLWGMRCCISPRESLPCPTPHPALRLIQHVPDLVGGNPTDRWARPASGDVFAVPSACSVLPSFSLKHPQLPFVKLQPSPISAKTNHPTLLLYF